MITRAYPKSVVQLCAPTTTRPRFAQVLTQATAPQRFTSATLNSRNVETGTLFAQLDAKSGRQCCGLFHTKSPRPRRSDLSAH